MVESRCGMFPHFEAVQPLDRPLTTPVKEAETETANLKFQTDDVPMNEYGGVR